MSPSHLPLLLLLTFTKADPGRGLFGFIFDRCSCRCGVSNRDARIAGGEQTGPHEYPWVALVHVAGRREALGSLINDRYVLSSGSLVVGATPYDVKVTTGVYDRCRPDLSSTRHSVEKLLVHPDFHGGTAHNLALIKLSSPATFGRRISPICLPHPSSKYTGQVASTVSWPQANEGAEESSCRPKKFGLPVLEDGHCGGVGCAGVLGGPSLVCKDDEGSPVMYRSYKGVYELVGVFSDENDCGGEPGVSYYARVGRDLAWIVQSTKDACYCSKM